MLKSEIEIHVSHDKRCRILYSFDWNLLYEFRYKVKKKLRIINGKNVTSGMTSMFSRSQGKSHSIKRKLLQHACVMR